MQTYEEQNPFQSYGGGGGFNPVQEPRVADAMERELRKGEDRNRLYYNSLTRNDKARVNNAQQAATEITEDIEANLQALGKFSDRITGYLNDRERGKIEREMQAAALKAWDDPLYAEEETKKYEVEESKIEEGQGIMDEAAVKYEANGGSPIVGEGLRVGLTGRNRLAYERARMERLSLEYPTYYASRLTYINGTQDPVIRAQREREVLSEFMTRTGAIGASPGMLNKYFMRNARGVMSKAQLAWTTDTEKKIVASRLDEAQSELFTGIQSGNLSSAAGAFLTKLQNLGYSALDRKKQLFDFLGSDDIEKRLQRGDVAALAGTPIDHPSCKPGSECTFGKVFAKELDALDGLVANNNDVMVQRNADDRAAKSEDYKNRFEELNAASIAAGDGPIDFNSTEEYRKLGEKEGWDTSFLDDHITAEKMPIEVAKRQLENKYLERGYLLPKDLEGLPYAVRNDPTVQQRLKSGSIRAGETEEQSKALEKSITRLTNEITSYNTATGVKGVEYDNAERGIRKALTAQYNANLQSGKYRNPETGELNYDQALADAVATVSAGAARLGEDNTGKTDYTGSPSETEIATRGNSRYQQRLDINRNSLKDQGVEFFSSGLTSSNAELDQALDAINGKGGYPAMYEDLAANQKNITPYDIAMAQLNKYGRKIEAPRVEQAVASQSPYVRQLLNFKNTPNRTERVFTPNMNSPEVTVPTVGKNYNTMVEGGRRLMQLGFPRRGAAYLAGNIQQESAWNGQRSWGQVMGDGTSRNGGLISWASWSNDPARLGWVEKQLGKPIEQANDDEQLAIMIQEMKTKYPSAYRTFMDPNASDADLRTASREYWGYGHEGPRFQYASETLRGL